MAYITKESSEFMDIIIEYLCRAYRTDYNGLADLIGYDRGWFTRYLNAEFGDKGFETTYALLSLAASVNEKQLIGALFNE